MKVRVLVIKVAIILEVLQRQLGPFSYQGGVQFLNLRFVTTITITAGAVVEVFTSEYFLKKEIRRHGLDLRLPPLKLSGISHGTHQKTQLNLIFFPRQLGIITEEVVKPV